MSMDLRDIARKLNGHMGRTVVLWLATAGFFMGVLIWTETPSRIPIKHEPSGQSQRTPILQRPVTNQLDPKVNEDASDYAQSEVNMTGSRPSTIEEWLAKYRGSDRKPNVLFLVADDMRPDIKAYAHPQSPWLEPHMVTPHLDQLAGHGLLVRRAYCQQSWCNPSRSSFLTSRRPDTTMVHNNSVFFRQNNPNFVTLPQYFKQQGYLTTGIGKVFHLMGLPGDHDDEHSWTIPMFRVEGYMDEGPRAWRPVTREERKGGRLMDEMVTTYALDFLNKVAPIAKSGQQPFFMAVGIKKPHLSFVFPSEYMDLYPLDNITMPTNPKAPSGLPGIAWFHSNEIRGRQEYRKEGETWDKDTPLADWVVRELRRAYWSTISYVDDLLGQVIQRLEELGLAEDTIISFVGDHGFHLGEHSIVGKNTNFEVANNSPMIIRVPGVTDTGLVTDRLVEFVDLFPTLAELAGLPAVPRCPGSAASSQQVDLCTEGSSLVPLLHDQRTANWKERVFFQYPRYTGVQDTWCMGYSVRTEQYRYTEWVDYHYNTGANWSQQCGRELYDHRVDPNETVNLAGVQELTQVIAELSSKLRAGWLEAVPR